jgi:hypothetical protein
MSYQIDRYNKTLLTVVEDGTIDQSTDLNFVGKNYAGYGEIHNENFLFLLENFAGANPPPRAISGQVWFDASQSKLKFYDGSRWRTTGGAETTGDTPTGLTEGDFWWDTDNEQLYAYNGTDFILIGPQDAGEGVTQMQSRSVRDINGIVHPVITSVVEDVVVHIISNDEFTIDTTDAENVIPGFDVVKKGITLVNTQAATNGTTTTDHVFWGTASGAKALVDSAGNRISVDDVVVTNPGQPTSFTEIAEFADAGLTIGDSNDLKIYVPTNTDNKIAISNEIGNTIFLMAKPVDAQAKNSIRITPAAVLPGVTNVEEADENNYALETVTIGTADEPFSEMFADNFTGLASKATALDVDGNDRVGAVLATPNTVAVRDGSGDLRANLFRGTALTARYADLAEKYTTDTEYPVGTVMAVGGDAEARAAKASDLAIGVISDKPAYLMNAEADGQAIALKGRVPVRVQGPVSKGQPVYAWDNGVCTTIASTALVGVALESSDQGSEKLIECVLKV